MLETTRISGLDKTADWIASAAREAYALPGQHLSEVATAACLVGIAAPMLEGAALRWLGSASRLASKAAAQTNELSRTESTYALYASEETASGAWQPPTIRTAKQLSEHGWMPQSTGYLSADPAVARDFLRRTQKLIGQWKGLSENEVPSTLPSARQRGPLQVFTELNKFLPPGERVGVKELSSMGNRPLDWSLGLDVQFIGKRAVIPRVRLSQLQSAVDDFTRSYHLPSPELQQDPFSLSDGSFSPVDGTLKLNSSVLLEEVDKSADSITQLEVVLYHELTHDEQHWLLFRKLAETSAYQNASAAERVNLMQQGMKKTLGVNSDASLIKRYDQLYQDLGRPPLTAEESERAQRLIASVKNIPEPPPDDGSTVVALLDKLLGANGKDIAANLLGSAVKQPSLLAKTVFGTATLPEELVPFVNRFKAGDAQTPLESIPALTRALNKNLKSFVDRGNAFFNTYMQEHEREAFYANTVLIGTAGGA